MVGLRSDGRTVSSEFSGILVNFPVFCCSFDYISRVVGKIDVRGQMNIRRMSGDRIASVCRLSARAPNYRPTILLSFFTSTWGSREHISQHLNSIPLSKFVSGQKMTVKSASVPTFHVFAGICRGLALIYECYLIDPASSHMFVSKIKPCMWLAVIYECYLVDPASSHMLVSKIKPCMCKVRFRRGSLRNGYHIQGRQQARKLPNPDTGRYGASSRAPLGLSRYAPGLNWPGRASGAVTLKKLECSKQAYALRTTAKSFTKDVFINQERNLGAQRRSDTVLVSTINDADQGSADVAFRTPLAPYEKSKFLGSGGVWSQG
uniref:Uncharacterized protein n=1 Tax=Brassica oleracea var. oleracea TaxID=109376 RepID=A0A0D2ZPC4_BRAOL